MEALAKLGIDGWGILLYLVNFGILLWVLHRYVYKPLVAFLETRQKQIKENVEEAELLKQQMQEAEASARLERVQEEAALQERMAKAKQLVKDDAKRLLQEAEAQRDAILTQAGDQRDALVAGALEDAEGQVRDRIIQVVTHVLKDGVPKNVIQSSVEESLKTLSATDSYGQ